MVVVAAVVAVVALVVMMMVVLVQRVRVARGLLAADCREQNVTGWSQAMRVKELHSCAP